MHLNSLTPMQISGTPRSFLNCRTSTQAVVIGGVTVGPCREGAGLCRGRGIAAVVERGSLEKHCPSYGDRGLESLSLRR